MSLDKYKTYLEKKNLDSEEISKAIILIEKFSEFFEAKEISLESVDYEDFFNFSELLIEQKENTYKNYVSEPPIRASVFLSSHRLPPFFRC